MIFSHRLDLVISEVFSSLIDPVISPWPYLDPWAFCYIFSSLSSKRGEWLSGFGGYLASSQGQSNTPGLFTCIMVFFLLILKCNWMTAERVSWTGQTTFDHSITLWVWKVILHSGHFYTWPKDTWRIDTEGIFFPQHSCFLIWDVLMNVGWIFKKTKQTQRNPVFPLYHHHQHPPKNPSLRHQWTQEFWRDFMVGGFLIVFFEVQFGLVASWEEYLCFVGHSNYYPWKRKGSVQLEFFRTASSDVD